MFLDPLHFVVYLPIVKSAQSAWTTFQGLKRTEIWIVRMTQIAAALNAIYPGELVGKGHAAYGK